MKTALLVILLFFVAIQQNSAQTVSLKVGDLENTFSLDKKIGGELNIVEISDATTEVKKIELSYSGIPANHTLKINGPGASIDTDINDFSRATVLNSAEDLLNDLISIRLVDAAGTEKHAYDMRIQATVVRRRGPQSDTSTPTGANVQDFLVNKGYTAFETTPFGLIDPTSGDNSVHIFFDQWGNNILSTIPQGISNAKYLVHIVYMYQLSDVNKYKYSVKQKSGSFNGSLLFNNTGIRSSAEGAFSQQASQNFDAVAESITLLGTATDDLSFDITVTDTETGNKRVLESYTIKKTPVYHGSFDVGLLSTWLANPDFTQVAAPGGAGFYLKSEDTKPRGIVTVMATFYVSPVVLIRDAYNKANNKRRDPSYKLYGRNFLDDHRFYERIYPAIGVSLSERAFNNVFGGVNFEVARGLSVFAGAHYGKVNTFKMPGFVLNETIITQEQFDRFNSTEWKARAALGVNVDILIIRNLFGGQ